MADETSDEAPDVDGAATPNRDRRHEPPIIEGEIAATEASVDARPAVEAMEVDRDLPNAPVADPRAGGGRPLISATIGAIVGAIVASGALALLDRRPAVDPAIVARIDTLEHDPALAMLDKRIAALETALAGTADRAALDAYGQRIAALESAALSAKAAVDATKDALATAQAAREDAGKALALASAATQNANSPAPAAPVTAAPDEGGAATVDSAALAERLGKLETAMAGLSRQSVDLGPVDQRLDKLESALAAPKSENRVPAESAALGRDGAGLAVVAQALIARLRAGASFPVELAALEHLGADPTKLAVLKPLSDKGGPTASALATDFAKLSPAILVAARPEGSGVIDRLMANMSKVVRVTPVGEVAGDDPTALVSQIGAALARGQIASALAAWTRLPEAARAASKEWASAAQFRLDADKAAQGVLDDAMARLAAANN